MKFIKYGDLILNSLDFAFKIECVSVQPVLFGIMARSNSNKELHYTLFINASKSECERRFMDLSQELEAVQMDEESWQDIAGE